MFKVLQKIKHEFKIVSIFTFFKIAFKLSAGIFNVSVITWAILGVI